jgi:DNA-binding NarL/FixJ family response regulator
MNQNKLILLADDHVIIRRGIKMILGEYFWREKTIETDSVKGIERLLKENVVTHMILDMQLTDGNILDILPEVRVRYPEIPILIYTMSSEEVFGARMINMGVSGFLSKQSNEKEAIKALDFFFRGKPYISEKLTDIITAGKNVKPENPIQLLSSRELIVLNKLLLGQSIKEISVGLDLKANTVCTYKSRIFEKLQVDNMMDLKNKCDLYHHTAN